jgi:hypothetical protein
MGKPTLVLGASSNPDRFSYKAIRSLLHNNVPVIAVGRRNIDMGSHKITKGIPDKIGPVHTITLYLSANNQKEYYNSILSVHPERIIFNPGTTNPELADIAKNAGIKIINDCMLVMLSSGRF